MLTAAVILSVIVLLALIRVGVIIEYNDEGPAIWLKIGFIKMKIKTDDKKHKPKRKLELDRIKPGSLSEFLDIFKIIKQVLGRIRCRLLIKRLVIHFTSAGDDPAKVAMYFGAANAVFGIIVPVLDRHFRIKRRDLRAAADFGLKEPGIYALINVSIAVWESIYVMMAVMPMFTSKKAALPGQPDKKAHRKGGEKNGEGADKQSTGNDNAKNQGDDRS